MQQIGQCESPGRESPQVVTGNWTMSRKGLAGQLNVAADRRVQAMEARTLLHHRSVFQRLVWDSRAMVVVVE